MFSCHFFSLLTLDEFFRLRVFWFCSMFALKISIVPYASNKLLTLQPLCDMFVRLQLILPRTKYLCSFWMLIWPSVGVDGLVFTITNAYFCTLAVGLTAYVSLCC